ncbi:adhesion G protein-coupled receptor E1-like [Kryptolebias marmoratus]|uniref:adhesion G protein-coupled receptor E1-like n=1 Tax=Kryptolebias marmoratus TaxID=37003 RepID=UPI0018ACE2DA|nr:adhesion G protein-coupled receptor E1-like [Kryptolebias marmoratus]XP_037834441.1 adhesion G protein-coupled receptor E1-like [Kryptolebias marmoratus]
MVGKWTLLMLVWLLPIFMAQNIRSCPLGFSSQPSGCVDVNECDPTPCGNNSQCFNTNASYYCQCKKGFESSTKMENFTIMSIATCIDINECLKIEDICGAHAFCNNTISSYNCSCKKGFISSTGVKTFHGDDGVTCRDIDECKEEKVCGLNSLCINTQGSYNCVCKTGFELKSGKSSYTGEVEQCEDMCKLDKTYCGHGTCHSGPSGHYCACHEGFTNYGNKKSRCIALDCGVFKNVKNLTKTSHIVEDHVKQLSKSCLEITEVEDPKKLDGEGLLKTLQLIIENLLSSKALNDNRKVSTFLDLVEGALGFIGPFITTRRTKSSSPHTELELLVHNGSVKPQETKTLSSKHAQLDIKMEVAAGNLSQYPGFTVVSLLSYSNLEESAGGFFSGMKQEENQIFGINSKVVTVTVSNTDTNHLKETVNITLYHLDQSNETSHTCVFWDSSTDGGTWSPRGCSVVESNPKYTVCSCNHLRSFAVLMALYEIEDHFELQLITWVGLSLSLICLFFCILTFSTIRSIQSPRTTIHLHLCISLFIAIIIFLAGITQTENKVGCAVVAGMLHFFYLAAFCWMCLEGIQLFRMVVLVFNTSFNTIYMMAGGYGVPAVIVAVSALVNAKGYGTKRYCWLNLDSIWSFFGPACVIIIVNIFFFLITAWKLAQKFSSLNPDMDSLQKIKAFIITAVAQMCILGTMWIFRCFQFEKGTIVMSYLFTIFGSFQGVMLFVMHCLFFKQVREEYANILTHFCAPRQRKRSEFSYSDSSKAQGSKSTQDTGESHI